MNTIQIIDECCPAFLVSPISEEEADQLAAAFRVLADPARLRIVSQLATAGEICVCELTDPLGLAQPTVSHHLKVLFDAGIVARQRRGTWMYYRLVPESLGVLRDVLASRSPARA